MRRFAVLMALSLVVVGWAGLQAESGVEEGGREEKVTLMGLLGEWRYPEATMPRGASMADGGNPRVQSIKCQAVLVTPDSFEKVVKFYEEKLGVSANGDPAPQAADAKEEDAKSV